MAEAIPIDGEYDYVIVGAGSAGLPAGQSAVSRYEKARARA